MTTDVSTFRVWAPKPESVALRVEGDAVIAIIPMERGAAGWWRLDFPQRDPASDYQYVVDGGNAVPDPRSAWQPQGVHGPSRWSTTLHFHGPTTAGRRRRFLPRSSTNCISELSRRREPSTAAIERLDHLVDAGHHSCRVDAGRMNFPATGAGATMAWILRAAPRVRRPGCTETPRQRLSRARARGDPATSSITTSAHRELPRQFGALLTPTRYSYPVGTSRQSRSRRQPTKSAASSATTR